MNGRNDPCWCGSEKKWKKCHFPDAGPPPSSHPFLDLRREYLKKYQIIIKNEQELAGIRRACLLSTQILEAVCALAKEGVTTLELDNLSTQMHKEAGAIPAALHYGRPPFPKGICTSLNEVICHGIPDQTVLKEGDILNVDVASILSGYYGDCSKMVVIGKVSEERARVVDVAYESLMRSIAILKPGVLVSAIGDVIESYAHSRNCSVVHQFVGHGVGVGFHEGPQVPHCRNSIRIPLQAGMTFTIEPMINAGKRDAVIDSTNQWVARTIDGKASAQWEHTVLITEDGCEILTPWKK